MSRTQALWLLLILTATACKERGLSADPDEATMMQLASFLTKVTRAAEGVVQFGQPSDGRVDLLTNATSEDPELLTPFAGYLLSAHVVAGHAVVLVCSKDGKRALLEDYGCTAQMDKHPWRHNSPCALSQPVQCPDSAARTDAGN